MQFCHILLALSVALFATAVPTTRYAVHERRDISLSSQWMEQDVKVDRYSVIPISIGLVQQNLENGQDFLMDVSHPDSPNYGKHWPPEKVRETFAPAEASIIAVKSWLAENEIPEERITLSNGQNWLRMNLTIHEAENLLKAEYKVFEHKVTAKRSLACDEYSVPLHIQHHIDYITPTTSSFIMRKVGRRGDPTKSEQLKSQHPRYRNATHIAPPAIPPKGLAPRDSGINQYSWDLSICGQGITRACIQALYNMPNGTLSQSSSAVVEYYGEAYLEYDLEVYLYNFVTAENYGDEPTVYVMEDASFQTNSESLSNDGEGNLDVQLALGLVYPGNLWYYQLDSDDVFLDAVDASYCSVDAASTNCGSTPLASVISTSWGGGENPGDAAQVRQCNEYMKLGLMGTTMLFSSGDSGVGSSCTTFQIEFPASCPYITAVGATQIPSGGLITSKEVAVTYVASGGGFSNYWPIPSYQASAISTYYKKHAPTYTSAQYNNSQKARGYPDISANGYGTYTVFNGSFIQVDGTSASAPIVGSVISLINEQRLHAGKSTVGFINPVLYANPSALNDITSGDNPGCGTNGFTAVSGWDPVTGLGTPNYQKLLAIWMALS